MGLRMRGGRRAATGPDGRELLEPPPAGRDAVGQRRDRGVDVLQHYRSPLFQAEVAQAPDYLVGRSVEHIELHRAGARGRG
jgi:hypothetical protein